MVFGSGKNNKNKPRGTVLAALDVGSTKVCCLIARVEAGNTLNVTGIGHQVSRGLRGGTIVDMEDASAAIGHAVQVAEQMAGETLTGVVANLAGIHTASRTLRVEAGIAGHAVGEADMRRALSQTPETVPPGSAEIIHTIPTTFAIDGNRGIRDPRGMFGNTLSADLHTIAAASSAAKNLASCVGRCHLRVDKLCASAYAAGLASLVEDEMNLGCTVIDMGGGTTGMAVFMEGECVWTDCVPLGGAHVTSDIARGLTTTLAHAERMKTLYGSAMTSGADEREMIEVPQVGEDDPSQASQVPRSLLVGIIRPRLEETFELVRSRLEANGLSRAAGRRVVLVGGASQMPGVRDYAQLILDKQIRAGRPRALRGLAESTAGPAFATTAGLLIHALEHLEAMPGRDAAPVMGGGGLFQKATAWMKENL